MSFNYCYRESTTFITKEGNDYNTNNFLDNQSNNSPEEFNILEEVAEDNQSEVNFNFINGVNVNDAKFKKNIIQLENNNIKSNSNHNTIIELIHNSTLKKNYESAPKMYLKRFENFLTKKGDKLIQDTKLPTKMIKRFKLHAPNLSFILQTKKRDNYKFLSLSVKDIFYYVKTGVDLKKNTPKRKNKTLIDTILDYIESKDEDEQFEEVKIFFKMTLEEAYKLFEESEDFKRYAMDPKTILLEKEFKKKHNFSLLEKNGFIKYIKMCSNIINL